MFDCAAKNWNIAITFDLYISYIPTFHWTLLHFLQINSPRSHCPFFFCFLSAWGALTTILHEYMYRRVQKKWRLFFNKMKNNFFWRIQVNTYVCKCMKELRFHFELLLWKDVSTWIELDFPNVHCMTFYIGFWCRCCGCCCYVRTTIALYEWMNTKHK